MKNKGQDNGFDVPPLSYWIDSVEFSDFAPIDKDINVDAAIVGGGIVGITTAYMLVESGLRVALIEADKLLHGSTGNTTAKVTAQHDIIYNTIESKHGLDMAQQYADANRRAMDTIASFINKLNIDCDFISQPAYVY